MIPGEGLLTLATFATEFRAGQEGTREGSRMLGTPAVILGRYASTSADSTSSEGLCTHHEGAEGLVALVSPHIEDGVDERTQTPFTNLIRLVSKGSFYQRWKLSEGARCATLEVAVGGAK